MATFRASERHQRPGRRRVASRLVLGIGLATALVAGGCAGGGQERTGDAGTANLILTGQSLGATECGTYSGTGCAPDSQRVDLTRPSFSNPTKVTNPLFPIGRLPSVVLVGQVDGEPFRSETTLLPETRTVEWEGRRIETLVSQYTAYRNGRIEEVAIDRYAQADDGSVWYLGEDVVDYRNGNVVTTEGTWLAGKEGPPAMIMPAHPAVGDVFRSENVPGIVFEQLTFRRSARPAGPSRPRPRRNRRWGTPPCGSREDQVFAPGFGEFSTGAGRNLEALAVAAPPAGSGNSRQRSPRSPPASAGCSDPCARTTGMRGQRRSGVCSATGAPCA